MSVGPKRVADPPSTAQTSPAKPASGSAPAPPKEHEGLTAWCSRVTNHIVGKTMDKVQPFIEKELVDHFHMTPAAAQEASLALIRALETDAVATDEGVMSKLMAVVGKVIPHAHELAGWGGVALGAGLAVYEFKQGDAFSAGSAAGGALLGAGVMVGAIGSGAALGANIAVAAEAAAAKKIYENAYINVSSTLRSQYFGGDPKQIAKTLNQALTDPKAPDAQPARLHAEAKAFNDYLDKDFLSHGEGLEGGAGHRAFTDYLEHLAQQSPEWKQVITTFYSRRSTPLDAATEQWCAHAMQDLALRFLDSEDKRLGGILHYR